LSVFRSGSTLLHSLLNQHSQIALLCEGDLPSLQLYLWGRLRGGTWRQRWEFWNRASSRHGIDPESMPTRIPDVWEATRTVYESVARRKGAIIWGDKTHWCDGALRLAEKFPDACFIFLWRVLPDTVGAIARGALTERFYRKRGLATKTLVAREKLKHACDQLKARGRKVHEVFYEDLAADPSKAMQQICHFLALRFEPRMASLVGADRSLIAGGERQHHAGLWGDRIAPQREKEKLIAPAMKLKIDRYICRWRGRYGDWWPKYCSHNPKVGSAPSRIELWWDLIIYRSLTFWDQILKVVYGAAPLAAIHSLRSWLDERSRSWNQSPGCETPATRLSV